MNNAEQVSLRFPSPYLPGLETALRLLPEAAAEMEATVWRRSATGFLNPTTEPLAIVDVDDPALATVEPLGAGRWRIRALALGQTVIRVRFEALAGEVALSILAPEPAIELSIQVAAAEGGVQVQARSEHQRLMSRRATAAHGLHIAVTGEGFALAADGTLTFPDAGQAQVEAQLGDLRAQAVVQARHGVVTLLTTEHLVHQTIAGQVSLIRSVVSRSDGSPTGDAEVTARCADERLALVRGRWLHPLAAGETTLALSFEGMVLVQRLHVVAPRIDSIRLTTNAGNLSMFDGTLYMSPGERLSLTVHAEGDERTPSQPDAEGFVEVTSSSPAVEIEHSTWWGLRAVAVGDAVVTARCAGRTATLTICVHETEINWY